MLPFFALSFVVFFAAAFTVQRTARRAEKPRQWTRNGMLGIATISMLVMTATLQRNGIIAFAILFAWLPGMLAGILAERWHDGRGQGR